MLTVLINGLKNGVLRKFVLINRSKAVTLFVVNEMLLIKAMRIRK